MKIYNNIINMNNKPYNWYSNQTVQTHGLNAKIVFEKYAPSPEISAKMCQTLLVWFGGLILDTFLVIS